jgi:class 3 adenylate cyclase
MDVPAAVELQEAVTGNAHRSGLWIGPEARWPWSGVKPEDAVREVSVLVADLRGFTALAERITPSRMVAILDASWRRWSTGSWPGKAWSRTLSEPPMTLPTSRVPGYRTGGLAQGLPGERGPGNRWLGVPRFPESGVVVLHGDGSVLMIWAVWRPRVATGRPT